MLKQQKYFVSLVFIFTSLFTCIAIAQTPTATNHPATEVFATMRDGTKLAADVYTPEGEGPWPVILMRTPYGKRLIVRGDSHLTYTDAGYVYVVQDVRGKGKSEGEYVPFYSAREDGYDTVQWVAEQSWSNGKVGMTGASAMGITANQAATMNPPALKAAYVIVAPHLRFDEATFMGGVFKDADVGGWMRGQGAGDQVADSQRSVLWDANWQARDTAPNLHNVTVPIYNDGGWYDIFNYGNVRNFMYLQNFGALGAKGRQKLSMGPYGHGALSGDLAYPGFDTLGIAGRDQEIRWFNYWLKDEDNGIMDEPAVRYYMMASARKEKHSKLNGWRTSETWPPPHRPTSFFLHANKSLQQTSAGKKKQSISYNFDPENPVPSVGGANLTFNRGPMDQREIGERDDYLRFETETLTEDLAVAGPVKVKLWISSDGPDTDFMAKLVDVYPDGYEAIVLDAPIRTRYRKGRRAEDVEMLKAGEPTLVEIDLWHTAITFEKGHKLAVHITSSNAPRFEVNDNNGTAPGEAPNYRTAKNTIYMDDAHPSAVIVPVLIE